MFCIFPKVSRTTLSSSTAAPHVGCPKRNVLFRYKRKILPNWLRNILRYFAFRLKREKKMRQRNKFSFTLFSSKPIKEGCWKSGMQDRKMYSFSTFFGFGSCHHPFLRGSFLSRIPPFLHLSCPASCNPLPSCIHLILHPSYPASLLSCIPLSLHPS